jgi:ubiquinone/menaquinone biosynthesis C-methylase UbiE
VKRGEARTVPGARTDGEEDRFSFTPFTRHPFFTQVNRWIVERVICPGRRVIVDLGCGPGAVTQLILERLPAAEPPARVIGVDPSPSALAKARAAISSRVAEFVQGSAEWLSKLVSSADAVLFLNAIHLVPDKARVLAEIRRVLKPGGVLAFNSTFFSGSYVEGTSGFWRRWIVRSVQALREKGMDVRHSHDAKATAMEWLSPEQYGSLCEASGLRPTTVELLQVQMTPESLADIGRFSLFIEGALPGVPLAEGSEALQVGLQRTMDELKVESVPRNWLEFVAEAD